MEKETKDTGYLVSIEHERLSFFTPAGEVKALNDVSFRLKEGEVLGIVGESGSGKSVTAYSLLGLTAHPGKIIGGVLPGCPLPNTPSGGWISIGQPP